MSTKPEYDEGARLYQSGLSCAECARQLGLNRTLLHQALTNRGVIRAKPTLRERFEDKWEVVTESGCWLWVARLNKHGYGTFQIGCRSCLAHRVSFEIYRSPIPEGMEILHKCDVRACVNPQHLYVGTQFENMRDRSERSSWEQAKGSQSVRSKLTEEDVLEIRRMSSAGRSYAELSERFGICKSNVATIVRRETWRHV